MQWSGNGMTSQLEWVGDERSDSDPQFLGQSGLEIVDGVSLYTFVTMNCDYIFVTKDD